MEKQFQSLNNSSDNLFDGVYEIRPSKVVGIIISVINIFLISPLLYFVIWYEKFGSNHNRSLINQFATSGCWTALAYCFLVQVPELLIALKGALGSPFCYLHLLLKNVLGIQYTLQAAAIPFVKYLYIFVLKNPSGQNDDFLCFFFNIAVILLATLAQCVFLFLPGRNSYIFNVCSGEDPRQLKGLKLNYSLHFSFFILFFAYFFVLFKIKCYSSKDLVTNNVTPQVLRQNQPLPSSIGPILQTMLANHVTLATVLIAPLPVMITSLILNAEDPEKLGTDLYYPWVQFQQHGCPFICSGLLAASYYITHRQLRSIAYRELKEIFFHETT